MPFPWTGGGTGRQVTQMAVGPSDAPFPTAGAPEGLGVPPLPAVQRPSRANLVHPGVWPSPLYLANGAQVLSCSTVPGRV